MKKQKPVVEWLLPSLVGVLLGIIGITLGLVYDLPFYSYLLILLGMFLGFGILLLLINLVRVRSMFRINRAFRRVLADDVDTVIAEVGEQWAQGDHSLENAIILSAAFSYQGNGVEGEKYAFETLAALQKRGIARKNDRVSRMFCDLGAITFYDAREAQGRFIEAAHYLRNRIPNAIQPNYLAVVVAGAFFLGHDYANARAALALVQPPSGRRNLEKWIPPKSLFMLAYLRYKLLGADMRPELNRLREQYPIWQKEAARNAANPYGTRLQEIVGEIGELLALNA